MDSKTLEHEQLKRLFDYTKFHIGMYTTLIATLVALIGLGPDEFQGDYRVPAAIVAVLFLLAGACGGIVAVNTFLHSSYDELMRSKAVIWGCLGRWTVRSFARLEHGFFWVGTIIGVLSAIAAP